MPSRSPSRRSSPISPRSRASSNRSPSYGMHGSSRRGRSPPSDGRRRRILSRGASVRSGDVGARGRGSEVRHPPRSVPPGSYPQGQYAGMLHGSSQHSPRRVAPSTTKRHSYSPPLPVVPSTSGLKRKYIQHSRSSSSSSSSPPRPQHRHMRLLKKKKLGVERMGSSREPPIPLTMRKHSRSKSPMRDKVHRSRSSSHYNVRDEDGNFDDGPVLKGSAYSSVGRPLGQTVPASRSYTTSPRRHDSTKRCVAEPVVGYNSGEGGVRDGRPIYRGPDKTETADWKLKQIKVGILLKQPGDPQHINRKILNPDDIVVVRRAGDARLESISPHPLPSVERQGRRGSSRPSYYNMSPSPPPRIASSFGSGRTRDYEQAGTSRTIPSVSSQSRHKEGRRGEDLRYELEYRRRDDTSYERGSRELRADSDGASSDLRMRINEKRTSDHRALSHYHTGEGAPVIHSKVVSERVYDVLHRRGEGSQEQRQRRAGERGGGHHSVVPSQHEILESEDFPSRGSFHNKSSSSSIPSWDGNPEYVPKGRAYYEHDNRDEEWVRMGGGGGPRGGRGGRFASSMGGRGRMFRGAYNPRGRGRGRGGGRGYFAGGGGPGRGYTRGGGIRRAVGRGTAGMGGSTSYSRGKATSPSLWKHDMFENLSSDENRLASASDMKR